MIKAQDRKSETIYSQETKFKRTSKWNKYTQVAKILTKRDGPSFALMKANRLRNAIDEINIPEMRKRLKNNYDGKSHIIAYFLANR